MQRKIVILLTAAAASTWMQVGLTLVSSADAATPPAPVAVAVAVAVAGTVGTSHAAGVALVRP